MTVILKFLTRCIICIAIIAGTFAVSIKALSAHYWHDEVAFGYNSEDAAKQAVLNLMSGRGHFDAEVVNSNYGPGTIPQKKYVFVVAEVNCRGRVAFSNIVELMDVNLSKEDICSKFKEFYHKTYDCGNLNFFNNCSVEIYETYSEAQGSYNKRVQENVSRFGGSSVFLSTGFSIAATDVAKKPVPGNKSYIVPMVQFYNSVCGNTAVIGTVISYDCSPLTVSRNFDAFYNKNYAKGIGFYIDTKNPGSSWQASSYEEAAGWRERQINILKADGWTIWYVNDFNDPCSETRYVEQVPEIKPADIAGSWNFVLSWPSAPDLSAVHGKIYFDIAGNGVIKGRIISNPNERLQIRDSFSAGLLKYNSLSFTAQTAVPEITQDYELTFNCRFKLTGTVRNVFRKPTNRPASWDIPAKIELSR